MNVRIVSATNEDPEQLIASGRLREDLFARLNGLTIRLPSLAARRSDILRIAARCCGQSPPLMSYFVAAAMLSCKWPRNVRELRKFAEWLAHLNRDSPAAMRKQLDDFIDENFKPAELAAGDSKGELTKEELIALLEEHGGNVVASARAAGYDRRRFYRLLASHNLSPRPFRRH